MKFEEALELLREGKKVRRSCWGENYHIFAGNADLIGTSNNDWQKQMRLEWIELLATDWEEYVEKDDWNFKRVLGTGNWMTKDLLSKLKEKILEDVKKALPYNLQSSESQIRIDIFKEIINKRFGF